MMRRLLLPVATIASVIAFYLIAPAKGEGGGDYLSLFGRDGAVSAARIELLSLGDTVRAVSFALQRTLAWEMARALPAEPAPFAVRADPNVRPETVRAFEQALLAQVAAIANPAVPVRLLVRQGTESGFYRKYAVIPQAADQPCVIVIEIPRVKGVVRPNRFDRLLGICGFYARYGPAGPGMQAWLEATRGIAAVSDTAFAPSVGRTDLRAPNTVQIAYAPAQASCLAGRDDDCAVAILDPASISRARPIILPNARTRAVVTGSANTSWYSLGQTLAAIRARVGDPRFAEIWRSEQSPAEAFQTATGEHIAVFARALFLRESLPHRPGPVSSGLSVLFSVSLGAACAFVAITRTRRARS